MRATGGHPNLRGQKRRFFTVTKPLYKKCGFLAFKNCNELVVPYSTLQTQKKIPVFNIKHWILPFLKFSKKINFFRCFFTKSTVLTSILTSEVTDIAPQPQSELEDMLENQSGTWKNLVQHMCKSQQTTSVNNISNE